MKAETTMAPRRGEVEARRQQHPPMRRRLPDERQALTHHLSVAGYEGYITVGLYDDGRPREIFITMAKEGSTISGVMDSFVTVVSVALQYGEVLIELPIGKISPSNPTVGP